MSTLSKGLYRHASTDAAAPADVLLNRLAVSLDTAWTAYTPTVSADSGAATTVTAAGRWRQIGSLVVVTLDVTVTNRGTAAGALRVTLPASAASTATAAGREAGSTGAMVQAIASAGGSIAHLYKADGSTLWVNGYHPYLTMLYEAAA